MPDTLSEFSSKKETLAHQEERGWQLLEDLQKLVPSLRDRGQASEEAAKSQAQPGAQTTCCRKRNCQSQE